MASSFHPGGRPEAPPGRKAQQALGELGLFRDFDGAEPELNFTGEREFQFDSAVTTPWAENNRVSGRLFRAGSDWRKRPSVILLHGWSAEMQYRLQFHLLGRALARAGVNAAMFELPYHGRRRPSEPGAIRNFISSDLSHMIEATRQSLSDARALLGWLMKQGSPSVGVWGVSLGAWLAGLLACAETRLRFAVLLTPVARVDLAIEDLAFCEPIRRALRGLSLDLNPLNLASHVPLLPPEKILLVESRYDLFAPAATVEDLWRAWGEPELWRLPHGHISVLLSPVVLKRVVNWVCAKAATTQGQIFSNGSACKQAHPSFIKTRLRSH
jgi:pimeloyl-ACP methyl ester carboxylesterase